MPSDKWRRKSACRKRDMEVEETGERRRKWKRTENGIEDVRRQKD